MRSDGRLTPRHLEHVPALAERVPGLRIVIDHLGKPPATRQLGPKERARIFGGTAIEVYRLANFSQAALLL
jgi:predicted TIM-barrel fold metal-dependent hydrolase